MARIDNLEAFIENVGRVAQAALISQMATAAMFDSLLMALRESGALSDAELGDMLEAATERATAMKHPMLTEPANRFIKAQILDTRRFLGLK